MTSRKTIAALVSLLALTVCAAPASADPLSMTFTEARANVGKQLSDAALFAAPDTAPLAAQINPNTGAISNGTLGVPDFETHIEEPIKADVTVDFDIGQITGSFNQATGALSLTGEAGGTLTATGSSFSGEECTVLAEPSPITLSTAGNSGGANPRSGVSFSAGLAGSGAIAGEWQNMSAEPVEPGVVKNENFCEDVENQIGGPGGIWMEQKDLVPPPAPQLISTDPASPSASGTPRILGSAEPGSTVRIYPASVCLETPPPGIMVTPLPPGVGAPGGSGSAAELASPGITVQIPEGTTAAFSATATDAAGNTSACSAPISYTRSHPLVEITDPGVTCTVPNLVGKKLGRARLALREAHCGVGVLSKPKHKKGKRHGALIVKSSTPAAGTTLAAGSPVGLKLGHKHHKPHRR